MEKNRGEESLKRLIYNKSQNSNARILKAYTVTKQRSRIDFIKIPDNNIINI